MIDKTRAMLDRALLDRANMVAADVKTTSFYDRKFYPFETKQDHIAHLYKLLDGNQGLLGYGRDKAILRRIKTIHRQLYELQQSA